MARFIAATNRDLQQMVIDGRFRSDLFYRLNVLSLNMPPLRDRGGHVLLLAQHFATQTERRYGLEKRVFSPEVTEMLMRYRWPGNVRELRHQISRAVLLSKTAQIRLQDVALPVELVANVKLTTTATEDVAAATRMTLDAAEKLMIEKTLEQTHFNISEAARQLGITRMAMRYRMEKHGIRA